MCLEGIDPKDTAVQHSGDAEIDPKIDPKLAGAITVIQCGIGSPTGARTWDLRIDMASVVKRADEQAR